MKCTPEYGEELSVHNIFNYGIVNICHFVQRVHLTVFLQLNSIQNQMSSKGGDYDPLSPGQLKLSVVDLPQRNPT